MAFFENKSIDLLTKKENKKRELKEFDKMCNYHQTSPNSHFTSKRLISIPTVNGRITITGNKMKIKDGELSTEIVLENESEFEKEIWNKFKIKKDARG